MIRKLACAAVAAFLLAGAAACGSDWPSTDQAPAPAAEQHDEADGMDCEADDKAKKETPDCGFYAGPGNKTFVWWSWVQAGRTTPPAGWKASTETKPYQKASPATAKPRSTRRAG